MVLIHIKRSDQEQFLFETTVSASVKETVAVLVELHNLRAKIAMLKLEGEELSKYGPAKPLDKQGIDEYAEVPVDKGKHYCMDPTGRRTGNACDPEVAKVLLRTLDEASATASKVQAEKKIPLTRALLMEAVDNVRGAVMICYPMGLPEWDLVRMLLEDREEDVGASYGHERLDADSATLWFAAKQMAPDKPLSEYLGRHEKTKAVLKLQKKGAGAPGREPPVDQETQKAMMAWYYKKQEEQKKLAEDDDDTYTSAAWASNKSLKTKFAGISAVRLP
ncbi:flagellar basal body protein [Haematococcus lacustris]